MDLGFGLILAGKVSPGDPGRKQSAKISRTFRRTTLAA
jgi:hypothetical protein